MSNKRKNEMLGRLANVEPVIKQLRLLQQFIMDAGNHDHILMIQTLLEDYKTELIISRYSHEYIDSIYRQKTGVLIAKVIDNLQINDQELYDNLILSHENSLFKSFLFICILLLVILGALLFFIHLNTY